jgi:hypothetical protein
MNLLHEAADSLPVAEANLAVCEYRGCEGVAPDVSAALTHTRDAAAKGEVDALLEIGAQLPAWQLSRDEVTSWRLIRASLQQSGCASTGLRVEWMKSNSEANSMASASAVALKLATQLWEAHGRQMMSSLGCAS